MAVQAAGGEPVLHISLPIGADDAVGALGVSPDGSRLVYSVTHPDHSAELRIASLTDGATLAVSGVGAADSPNWSPAGDRIAVLGTLAAGPRSNWSTSRPPCSPHRPLPPPPHRPSPMPRSVAINELNAPRARQDSPCRMSCH
jgi:hypothetical protein